MTTPLQPARDFPIGAVLTVAVGSQERMLCTLADLYDVLGHLLATVPAAEQIDGAIDACRSSVVRQHPQLADVVPPAATANDTAVLAWLAGMERRFGTTLALTSMQAGAR